jgi:hypothetical protein
MTRDVTSAVATEILKPVTQPGYFIELAFASGTVRHCTFGTTTWNSLTWTGMQVQCDGMDGEGKQARVSYWDPDATMRTLCIGGGIRNRQIKVWKAQYAALGATDPNMIFYGVGDSVEMSGGRTTIHCARLNFGVMLAPRRRISAATGFNFLAPAGKVIQWGDAQITLQPARR